MFDFFRIGCNNPGMNVLLGLSQNLIQANTILMIDCVKSDKKRQDVSRIARAHKQGISNSMMSLACHPKTAIRKITFMKQSTATYSLLKMMMIEKKKKI